MNFWTKIYIQLQKWDYTNTQCYSLRSKRSSFCKSYAISRLFGTSYCAEKCLCYRSTTNPPKDSYALWPKLFWFCSKNVSWFPFSKNWTICSSSNDVLTEKLAHYSYLSTLQMLAGIYRVFTGKSEYRDFKFMGIAGKVCLLTLIEAKRQTLPAISAHALLLLR